MSFVLVQEDAGETLVICSTSQLGTLCSCVYSISVCVCFRSAGCMPNMLNVCARMSLVSTFHCELELAGSVSLSAYVFFYEQSVLVSSLMNMSTYCAES